MSDSATILVRRPRGGNARLRKFEVYVDNEWVASLKRDDEIALEVDPGQHVIKARLAKVSSPDLVVEVASSEVVIVQCTAPGNPLAATVTWFTRRDEWLRLEVVRS